MTATALKRDALYNPLDIAETVVMERDWACDRTDSGELVAEAAGAWCRYHVWFTWEEAHGGLTLACMLDAKFPKVMLPKIHSLLAIVNEKLWLGHFDVCSEEMRIAFRHALLVKGDAGISAEQLSDLLDIAVEECERFYPAFQSVAWGNKDPEEALALSLFETVAEA